ncbi:helix-turn-helix transcriptional regulator (plasmid) [Agrobacterium fabrum]|nr:helix-turn-helix transcriptional regulator [Agrobacterium fabrum]UXT61469.1 helix-turn-helix transcriptional regulator [Agrobacterium fabrum]
MTYKTEHIRQQLRAAREGQKVSQRELSARSGLTQSHISQIERGTMEPGLGSLVDVVRALDLEIVLAPKKLMPAIRNILDSNSALNEVVTADQRKLVARLERWTSEFSRGIGTNSDTFALKDSLVLLRHLPLTPDELDILKRTAGRLDNYRTGKMPRQEMREIAQEIRGLRNAAVHRDRDDAVPRSAYALDEEADDA